MSNYQEGGEPYVQGGAAQSGQPPLQQGGPPHPAQPRQGAPGPYQQGGYYPQQRRPNVRSTFKTTEFWAFVVAVIAILVAAAISGSDSGAGFDAQDAWKYVTALTIGYMISRGLTKFGGHEHDGDEDRH